MAEFKSVRRYYLRKRLRAAEVGDDALASTWQHKQEAETGTALPTTFPHAEALAALGYTTTEDLDGADVDELVCAGLKRRQAEDAIGALS